MSGSGVSEGCPQLIAIHFIRAIPMFRKIFHGFKGMALTLSANYVKGYELVALWRSDGAAWNPIQTP
jgi:hypothetical protein